MDINTLRGLSTILVMIVFAGICWWAFSNSKKKDFEDASNLPFDDEDIAERTLREKERDNHD
ncbi:cytochrome oxidase [Oleiphilus sp. HI0009]|uniref:CcoQ/FixQ family Cbb3-type cytochrome c oxidase assembly chaperone n=1 Tax=unclassified Oleiphilus TaxID=2631174 RepID=UPI0007C34360|nr:MULTISPECIES: CcoQ/FixQ family Cbb3-type cytochrome c oxidase assembly chaperone [unclassified Oleiphilus]KZX77084.1 cytochrome oxidase [Oleiphilus sp. HI0009]KZX81691.1 cytochrome oxidase [Oleiphilus sp. HI0009]KZY66544.1 cytochrome oxidase [Oleiphilus sp. HI0066]KZY69601.1 cytochrome oxidase [Oleiphilus sp. HI0067]KZZ62264.1 cytochrome oxidase [Oleiphilus sp. HI0125]